ncbi:MAG: ATP-binding protein [Oligoflexia bacterium]|nr:ATP-binding protein [Oligoflexia bacterium]
MKRLRLKGKSLLNLKNSFEESRETIKNTILSEDTPQEKEINIQKHYRRSTSTLGNYVTLDWEFKEDIERLKETITDYRTDTTRNRPLNIIMLAEPGSGKSYFIKCLPQQMSSVYVSAVDFNMATLRNIDDLIYPLDAVRNLKVIDRLPLLFLDEFDSDPLNYSLLLPLLWDGELHVGHRDLKLGKVVIIMAGSDSEIGKVMDKARSMQKEPLNGQQKDSQKKLIDLLSRINGGVLKIPDLDFVKGNRDRRVDKICLSISLLHQRFRPNLQLAPWAFLRFIALSKFRYGVRSISHLIDLIPWNPSISDRLLYKDLKLPLNSRKELKNSSLSYHLIADEESEAIIDMWKDFANCETLIRFQPEPEEEDT